MKSHESDPSNVIPLAERYQPQSSDQIGQPAEHDAEAEMYEFPTGAATDSGALPTTVGRSEWPVKVWTDEARRKQRPENHDNLLFAKSPARRALRKLISESRDQRSSDQE